MTRHSRLFCLGFALSCALHSFSTHAQSRDAATRRLLIDQAQNVARAEHHTRAVELAMRAVELGMTPSLRRFLAEQQLAAQQPLQDLIRAEFCLRETSTAVGGAAEKRNLASRLQFRGSPRNRSGLQGSSNRSLGTHREQVRGDTDVRQ